MKLAILATIVFLAGLWSGFARSTGPLPDAPRPHQSATAKPAHPVLVKVASALKLRL